MPIRPILSLPIPCFPIRPVYILLSLVRFFPTEEGDFLRLPSIYLGGEVFKKFIILHEFILLEVGVVIFVSTINIFLRSFTYISWGPSPFRNSIFSGGKILFPWKLFGLCIMNPCLSPYDTIRMDYFVLWISLFLYSETFLGSLPQWNTSCSCMHPCYSQVIGSNIYIYLIFLHFNLLNYDSK